MRYRILGLLICTATAIVMSLSVSAHARNLSTSHQNFRIIWTVMTFREASSTVQCPVTLEGSLHQRTIVKTFQTLMGYITRANVASASCTGGTVTPLAETLPWHVRYSSFSGTLPRLTEAAVRIVGMSFSIRYTFVTCLIRTEPAEPGMLRFIREAGGRVITAAWNPAFNIIQTGAFCGSSLLELVATGEVFVLNTATRITLTLI